MAMESRTTPAGDGRTAAPERMPPAGPPTSVGPEAEPSLGTLFRELAQESSTLIKQEMNLAKTELRESFRHLARDAAMLAIGGALLLVGLLALTAFLIVALGDLLDSYWLGALIVGLAYAAIGGVLLMRGKKGMQEGEVKPERTLASLQADKRWAKEEMQQVKRDLTS